MNVNVNCKRFAQLVVVLFSGLAVKLFYSSASVNELRWILAPTTFLVELITGSQFEFESYAGYVNSDRGFVIAASCSGVNFLITAFLMLSLSRLWRARSERQITRPTWKFIPTAAAVAYVVTLVANAIRISTALQMRASRLTISWLTHDELHRLEGIVVYFGFLLLLFVVNERLRERSEPKPKNSVSLIRQFLFPLLIYYATTLGIPIANAASHSGPAATDFWEHLAFVFLTPLVLISLLIAVRIGHARGSRSQSNYCARVVNLAKRSSPTFPPVNTPTTFLPRK